MPVVSINGFQMSYEMDGAGPPLLLLHGFTGSNTNWRHVFDMERLRQQFTVIAPDARGHGRSTNPDGNFSQRQCATDAFALLDLLGIEKCLGVGASLGGNTLLHMAASLPHRIEAMVISGSPVRLSEQAKEIMRSMTIDSRTPDEWQEMRSLHAHGDEQIRELWDMGRGFADDASDFCFPRTLLAAVRARTLLVNGDRDPLYPVEQFVEMYRSITNCELWIVPGGGHAPIFSGANPAFASKAVEFLGRA